MNGGFLRKGWESLRQDGYSLPPSRGKVPPQGADEDGYRGCGGHRTGGWGHPPLRRVTIDFVGAAVPSGPESPRRFAALPPFTRGAAVTHHQAPLSKADSPYQGEMSRRDKRDRASWHGAAVTEGFRTSVAPLIRHGLRPCHLPPGEGFFPMHNPLLFPADLEGDETPISSRLTPN